MDWYAKAFVKASITWLALGVTLGVGMAAYPAWIIYRPAHMHMVLLGFVAMMIFVVAYHVIPRFTGFPLHSRKAPAVQWFISNGGLALMITGFLARPDAPRLGSATLAFGGSLAAIGAYIFAYVIWRTIDGPAALRKSVKRASSAESHTALPLAQGE
jgi:cbb3-type cytochrome oxidase subunit 1